MAVKVGQAVAFYPSPDDPGYENVKPREGKTHGAAAVLATVKSLDDQAQLGEEVSLTVDGVTVDGVARGEGDDWGLPHTYSAGPR